MKGTFEIQRENTKKKEEMKHFAQHKHKQTVEA